MGERRRNRGGGKLLIVVALGPFCAAAADLPVREVTSQATRVAGNAPLPAFQRGYLYWLDGASVRLYTPDGHPAFVRVLSVPGGAIPTVDGLAVDSDGSVTVAVSCAERHAGGILFLDKNGIDTGFLDTGAYLLSNLVYANSLEWVELDLNGNPLRRVPIKSVGPNEFAFTSDDHLYCKKYQRSDTLLLLNKTTPDWQDAGPSPGHHLLGPDGDQLVYSSGREGPVDLQWFAQPTSKGP